MFLYFNIRNFEISVVPHFVVPNFDPHPLKNLLAKI